MVPAWRRVPATLACEVAYTTLDLLVVRACIHRRCSYRRVLDTHDGASR
jgi:hypothetical protein